MELFFLSIHGLLLLPLRNPLNSNLKGHHSKYINPLDLLHMRKTNLNFESNHYLRSQYFYASFFKTSKNRKRFPSH